MSGCRYLRDNIISDVYLGSAPIIIWADIWSRIFLMLCCWTIRSIWCMCHGDSLAERQICTNLEQISWRLCRRCPWYGDTNRWRRYWRRRGSPSTPTVNKLGATLVVCTRQWTYWRSYCPHLTAEGLSYALSALTPVSTVRCYWRWEPHVPLWMRLWWAAEAVICAVFHRLWVIIQLYASRAIMVQVVWESVFDNHSNTGPGGMLFCSWFCRNCTWSIWLECNGKVMINTIF
jgi:hypothetical protein